MKFTLACILVLTLINAINCWWDVGHMLVAQVAKNDLVFRNRTLFSQLRKLNKALNSLSTNTSQDFVQSASWMDDIKSHTGMDFFEPWHYINRPIVYDGTWAIPPQVGQTFNSPDGVHRCMLSLQTNSSDMTMERAMFLRIIIHLIGDIHQPLHNTNFYNSTFNTGDLGGNLVNIVFLNGSSNNLHAYWDSGALMFNPNNQFMPRPLNDSSIEYMENWGFALMAKYPREFFADKLKEKDVAQWTMEGNKIAFDFAYPAFANTDKVSVEYESQAREIIKQQIALGGYRLSDLLYEAFISNPPQNDISQ